MSPIRLDLFGDRDYYLDHMLPIFEALPHERRGTVYTEFVPTGENAVLTASHANYMKAVAVERKLIIAMDHGVGQPLVTEEGKYYSNKSRPGSDRSRASLLLVPGQAAADATAASNPGIPIVQIGMPKLDPWMLGYRPENERPKICISFHWDDISCPEARSAWREYIHVVPELKSWDLFDVVGHAHPRIASRLKQYFREIGVPFLEHFSHVLRDVDLYASDCSSTIFEFAATGRPVMLMNSKHYRRDVNHGLRFWDAAHVGKQVNGPGELFHSIAEALRWPEELRADAVARGIYPTHGRSSQLAAKTIVRFLESKES